MEKALEACLNMVCDDFGLVRMLGVDRYLYASSVSWSVECNARDGRDLFGLKESAGWQRPCIHIMNPPDARASPAHRSRPRPLGMPI